jgi:hypothetical protein
MKLLVPYKPLLILLLLLIFSCSTKAYSVLTHEALVDASWDKSIKPLLKIKYPMATDADLKTAHGYAYGGSLIADIGYFPYRRSTKPQRVCLCPRFSLSLHGR